MTLFETIKAFWGIDFKEPEKVLPEKDREINDKIKSLPKEKQEKYIRERNELVESKPLENILCDMEKSDYMVAMMLAGITVAMAAVIDSKGKSLENKIDKQMLKINKRKYKVRELDNNNPFDFVSGSGHRTKMFHDFNLLKKINSDFVMRNAQTIEEYMQEGKQTYRLIELIEKRYGTKKGLDIIKIVVMHYAKDIVTQDGLPIMLSSVFTKCSVNKSNTSKYSFTNKFYQSISKELASYRLSDLTSYGISKIVISVYSKCIAKERNYNDEQKKDYINLMKIVTWSLMIMIQMILFDRGVKNGGRLNLAILPEYIFSTCKLIKSVNKGHKDIINRYEELGRMFVETENSISQETENVTIYKEYNKSANEEYFFENDNNWYIREDIIKSAIERVKTYATEENLTQIVYLQQIELLKYDLARGKINTKQYRNQLEKLMRICADENGFCILDETDILLKFYDVVNELYREKQENGNCSESY